MTRLLFAQTGESFMSKRKSCLRKGCRNRLPTNRTKYCSNECMSQHLYVDQRLSPKLEKLCKYDQCMKPFTGSRIQKFCSIECRIKHQYGVTSAAFQAIANAPKLCICCDPPKKIVGKGQYCPENAWMKHVTQAEKAEHSAKTILPQND